MKKLHSADLKEAAIFDCEQNYEKLKGGSQYPRGDRQFKGSKIITEIIRMSK